MIIGSFYRPPKFNNDMFNIYIENKISPISSDSVNVVMGGDFNLDLLTMSEDRFLSPFYESMNTLSLIPPIARPTRITGTSCTLIA